MTPGSLMLARCVIPRTWYVVRTLSASAEAALAQASRAAGPRYKHSNVRISGGISSNIAWDRVFLLGGFLLLGSSRDDPSKKQPSKNTRAQATMMSSVVQTVVEGHAPQDVVQDVVEGHAPQDAVQDAVEVHAPQDAVQTVVEGHAPQEAVQDVHAQQDAVQDVAAQEVAAQEMLAQKKA